MPHAAFLHPGAGASWPIDITAPGVNTVSDVRYWDIMVRKQPEMQQTQPNKVPGIEFQNKSNFP